MKLEYLNDLSDKGHFKDIPSNNLIRLYEFTPEEVVELMAIIKDKILSEKSEVNISSIDFIKSMNCNLLLKVGIEDKGILKEGNDFICELTLDAYYTLTEIMEPFSSLENNNGFNWLCNTSKEDIDFLFSPNGNW